MYLCDRRSVCFNHNPGLALADDPRPGFDKPEIRASNLLVSSSLTNLISNFIFTKMKTKL
jgi:hypothetical protein